MNLTAKDKARAEQYRNCKPKQFGNLHERMKYVIELLDRGHSASSIGNDLWHALFDLMLMFLLS